MFVYYGHAHVYSPGPGADNPLGTKFFHKQNYSVYLPISCKFCSSNRTLTIFPIQMHGRPMLTLPHKIGQSHVMVMIYINFVELYCLMLHAKIQNHRPSGSGEEYF